ncbi:hypothetical protein GCM10011504_40830 [Siccirubricoccus deserti]|uniref:Uncharacterized protein n=1 Tax=Siccirubricoccus deserti TaxID=2013562 RepID=A0A9X0R2Y3_9PROT|nr:hypothetical protein [Siccirubricoccus deserti]MBC4017372.1 hypothetical protein [Siccirubricoccus deserti]GGC58476.1 hypothetical protein GCM10011504_40830 [Siccirubricoccus deserti]
MTPPELRDLLADALALWAVPGRLRIAEGGVALEGMALRVYAADAADRPVRWWLERPGQRRPCTSVLGLLRALRNAVGAGEGEARRLRVALAGAPDNISLPGA